MALDHLESVPEKLSLLEDFRDFGESHRQREIIEERYTKYKEIVGSLQQQLEDSKRRIKNFKAPPLPGARAGPSVPGKPLAGRTGLFTCRVCRLSRPGPGGGPPPQANGGCGKGNQHIPLPASLPVAPIGLERRTTASGSRDRPNLQTREVFRIGYFQMQETKQTIRL
ncbi:hypothetical protein UY3_17394 [Chelonia mydas]|uniref:Centrosomal protein of 128 kDa n=1 Tax=Chelonia mydas TaxID=8469 RepID=M7AK67_CHEMY|nr:hypothetical protein UY3_17394 [Chelonia mydas]